MAAQRDGRSDGETRRCGELDRQHDLTLVAEAHERAHGQTLRTRPDDRSRDEALGQVPLDARRLARVARIDPVGMPTGGDALVQPDPERGSRLDAGGVADERHSDARGTALRDLHAGRRGGEDGSRQEAAHQEPHDKGGGERADQHREARGYDFTFSKRARYLPYPSASSLVTGMNRSEAELMQ